MALGGDATISPVTESEPDPRIGTTLVDRYRIISELSGGGMGVVYKAERINLGRLVAIKFLHQAFTMSPEFLRRFELEARTMSKFDHPNCVSVIDFGVADAPFIVMDYVKGENLKTLIVEDGPMAPGRAIDIVQQMLAGLGHAHEKGIIHRDIKPANVMLSQHAGTGDHVRILDFGLAKLAGSDVSTSSAIVGTPSYMSPEQAGASKTIDGRSDVYSAAVVLFELLTGRKPFVSDQPIEVLRMHIERRPPALTDVLPEGGFSLAIEAVLRRALAKNPDERFQTPEAFSEALEGVPESVPGSRSSGLRPAVAARSQSAPRARTPRPVSEREHSLAPVAKGRSVGWLVLLLLVAGGFLAWDRLGRPGLGKAPGSPAALPAAPPRPSLDNVKRLIASGDRDGALRVLHELRRQNPKDGNVAFLIGSLYFDKGWRVEALAAYGAAIDADPAFRTSRALIGSLIDDLDDAQTRDKARVMLLQKIGAPARAQVQEAVHTGRTPEIRKQAAALLKDLPPR
jgi:hypothetical protein